MGALEQVLVRFVALGPPALGEVAGPPGLDLVPGEARPGPRVALAELWLEHDRAHPELFADDAGGVQCPLQIGRHDDVDRADAPGGGEGLAAAEVGEGRIGLSLPPAEGVPLGLAVADEEDLGHRRAR